MIVTLICNSLRFHVKLAFINWAFSWFFDFIPWNTTTYGPSTNTRRNDTKHIYIFKLVGSIGHHLQLPRLNRYSKQLLKSTRNSGTYNISIHHMKDSISSCKNKFPCIHLSGVPISIYFYTVETLELCSFHQSNVDVIENNEYEVKRLLCSIYPL